MPGLRREELAQLAGVSVAYYTRLEQGNGRNVSDEEFKGLTAIRRFRGDEGWNRRPNAPGLGIAVAREVADRSGWKLDLRRPDAGGFEVEFTGGLQPKRT